MRNNLFLAFGAFIMMLACVSCETNSPSSGRQVAVTVAEAVEIGNTLDNYQKTTEKYAVTGYVIDADEYGVYNENTQTFYLSDDINTSKASLIAYHCIVPASGVSKGDKVVVTGEIMQYNGVRIEEGTTKILIKYDGGYDFTPSGTIDGHDYVDLGLSVKWATTNVGASSIEGTGEYYAWQETTPITSLTAINYQLYWNPCNPETNILSSRYDAARMNWGKQWRMPTYDDFDELCSSDKCSWTFVRDFQGTGVSGCIIKSKITKKSLFLPVTGYYNSDFQKISEGDKGYYWSSYGGPGDFWKGMVSVISMTFHDGQNFSYGGSWSANRRYDGLPVRAVVGQAEEYIPEGPFPTDEAESASQGVSVSGKVDGYTYVDLGLPSRTLWATYNVGATKPMEYGDYFAWGETTPKDYYWDTTYKFYDGTYGQYNRYSKYTWFKEHHGTIDRKFILDPEDDAATQNMGNHWCMPTKAQMWEICDYVKWTQKSSGGDPYYVGESKVNGNTIILPCAGWEYRDVPNGHNFAWYWSSELMEATADGSDYFAYQLIDSPTGGLEVKDAMRIQGLSVRGVVKK